MKKGFIHIFALSRLVFFSFISLLLTSCFFPAAGQEIDLGRIKLPPGFRISLYARNLPNARSLALSPNGTLFVGTRLAGRVYAVLDREYTGASFQRSTCPGSPP